MLRFIARRLAASLPVLVGISILSFAALELSPGDPALIALRALLNVDSPPDESVARLREEMGLNAPLHARYLRWVARTLTGDLGFSYQTRRPAAVEIMSVLPATALLAVATLVLILLLVIPCGIASAIRKHSLFDRTTLLGSLLAVAIPDFFLGVLFILAFSLGLGWFPVAGYGSVRHLVLPALTLAAGNAAVSVRVVRAAMLEVLGTEYVTTARAKGIRETVVVAKHAFRNALIPILTYVSTQFGYLFGGAVVVESLFRWPGLGRLLVDSVSARDVMVVQGCVLVTAGAYVIINLVVDALYGLIDPRIRLGETHAP